MATLVATTFMRGTLIPVTQSAVSVRDMVEADELLATSLGIMLADGLITALDLVGIASDWAYERRNSNGSDFLSMYPISAHYDMTFAYLA